MRAKQRKHRSTPTWIFNNAGWRCGFVVHGALFRKAKFPKHIFTLHGEPAWSFDETVISQAERLGAHHIRVTTEEAIYDIGMESFRALAEPVQPKGWQRQLAVPLEYWKRRSKPVQLELNLEGQHDHVC